MSKRRWVGERVIGAQGGPWETAARPLIGYLISEGTALHPTPGRGHRNPTGRSGPGHLGLPNGYGSLLPDEDGAFGEGRSCDKNYRGSVPGVHPSSSLDTNNDGVQVARIGR